MSVQRAGVRTAGTILITEEGPEVPGACAPIGIAGLKEQLGKAAAELSSAGSAGRPR